MGLIISNFRYSQAPVISGPHSLTRPRTKDKLVKLATFHNSFIYTMEMPQMLSGILEWSSSNNLSL